MKNLITALVTLICSGLFLVADVLSIVPETIPVGYDSVMCYMTNSINRYGVSVSASTNTLNPNDQGSFKVIAIQNWQPFTATNGVIDEGFLRGEIWKVSHVALMKDPTRIFKSSLVVDTTNYNGYGGIESQPYRLLIGSDGKYSLPPQATNAPLTEGSMMGIYVKGVTRVVAEFLYNGAIFSTMDSDQFPGCISREFERAYLMKQWLTNGYGGTIYLYAGTGASATVTKYDLATGKKILPLRLTVPVRSRDGKAQFTITGTPGVSVIVECSTNSVIGGPMVWVAKPALENPSGTTIFIDDQKVHTCLYRARYVQTQTQTQTQ